MEMKNPKIVVTLTTIPDRLVSNHEFDMKYCIKSLIEQTYEGEYEIHINIPHVCLKTNQEYVIPEWLTETVENNPKVKIYRTDDHGPLTKVYPTLGRVEYPEAIIIVCDDDIIYHTDMVKEHVNNQNKWGEYPVGYDGMRSRTEDGRFSDYFKDSRDHYYSGTHRDSYVDIVQHYKSVSYKRRFFEEDFGDFVNQYYTWDDDLFVSAYFASKKRKRMITFYPDDSIFEPHDEWLANVGKSFPLVQSTHHESVEGCNLFRRDQDNDNSGELYKFIDRGYDQD